MNSQLTAENQAHRVLIAWLIVATILALLLFHCASTWPIVLAVQSPSYTPCPRHTHNIPTRVRRAFGPVLRLVLRRSAQHTHARAMGLLKTRKVLP